MDPGMWSAVNEMKNGLYRLVTYAMVVLASGSVAFAQAPPGRPRLSVAEQEERRKLEDEQLRKDWAYLNRYRAENSALGGPVKDEHRVVFMGDSITEGWVRLAPDFFQGRAYLDRGISGQTTPQVLVRFRQDVINLHPSVVVILAGTNDIAENTGPSTPEMIQDNLASMVELAKTNGIQVVLASITPADDFWWNPGTKPAGKIAAMNRWIKDYATKHQLVYLDYYSALADENGAIRREFSEDRVHPNAASYRVMGDLADKAVAAALANRESAKQ
jgi:lysophospholipase L1-like esterase